MHSSTVLLCHMQHAVVHWLWRALAQVAKMGT
uniref:Uncharacterized protein n=1 Tax=Arundo donax TaxID=35708 RepID=A0A0A9HK94_ARUDO